MGSIYLPRSADEFKYSVWVPALSDLRTIVLATMFVVEIIAGFFSLFFLPVPNFAKPSPAVFKPF